MVQGSYTIYCMTPHFFYILMGIMSKLKSVFRIITKGSVITKCIRQFYEDYNKAMADKKITKEEMSILFIDILNLVSFLSGKKNIKIK